jgi:hypothetical protein
MPFLAGPRSLEQHGYSGAAGSCIEGMIIATHEELLRRLALHDEPYIQSALGIHLSDNEAAGLAPRPMPSSV